jgi:hypothetical protein
MEFNKNLEMELKLRDEELLKKFKIIPATQISVNDSFLNYISKSKEQMNFKEKILNVLMNEDIKNFRVQGYDPRLKNNEIIFESGLLPELGKSPLWWEENAKNVLKSKNSRLGNENERLLFVAYILKRLVETNWNKISYCWHEICNDSVNIARYINNTLYYDFVYERTGDKRVVSEFSDLGNVSKIIKSSNDNKFYHVGGARYLNSYEAPIINQSNINYPENNDNLAVGWIVMDE